MAVAMLLAQFLKSSLLLLLFQFCNATDTITPNRFIKDGETLVSNRETFALGFFRPGNSPNRYVGIWYNKVLERTVVWVANRDNPITNSSGVLKIDDHGIPSIFNGNSSLPIWSPSSITLKNSSTTTSSPTLKLLDSGNLVLIREDTGIILWQSFDYPTDTFLPGMKLGSSPKTGLNWSLTSWKSPEDPGTGEFTFSLDRVELPVLFLRRGRELVWRSGHWNGRAWSGIPEMTRTFIFNNSFVNNPDETYVNYTMHNSSILSRLYLDASGHVLRSTWVEGGHGWNIFWSAPKDSCDNYGECGAFGSCNSNNNALVCSCLPGFGPKSPRDWYMRDGAQGGVREREVGCGNGDGFLKMERLKTPDTSNSRVNMSLGLKDCEMECRKNCSCTGFATADVNGQGSGCLAWFGNLTDIREYADGGQDLYVRVDAITLAENAKRKSKGFSTKKKMAILSVAIAVGVLILISVIYWSLKKTKRRGSMKKERIQRLLFNVSNSESRQGSPCAKHLEETNANFDLPIFDLDTIMAATQNFSPSNKLGSGGFGSVYKGRLIDGREIAAKRLSKNSRQGVNEFKNEVLLIAKLQHRNLVQILGCCVEEEEKMLIYEYMPNKSLDFFLFDRARSRLLDWRLRYEIILGIARGVLYLHQDSRLRIIHRDLKASNILLDAEMTPKISDFGMARIFGGDQIQANTNRVVGTYGYMSPEYAMDGLFSIKSDVFSFGVLLLEIISGTKNSGYYHEDPSMNLLKHAWELWRDGRALELVDPSMADSYPEQVVLRCIQVGILCVQEKAKDRPTMSSVIFMLGNKTSIPSIRQPAFVLTRYSRGPDSSTTGTGSCSVNEISTTAVEGR